MNEKRGISWLSLYMYAYLIVGTIVLSNTSLGGEIPDEYKNNLSLFWGEKACIISVCGLALYNFLALFKRWPNAVQISNTYLGVIILLNGLNLLLGDINTSNTEEGQKMARSIIAIVTAVTWILYFKKSNEINALFPRGERRLFGRDVLIICAAIAIPPILLLLGVSNKDEGFKSVMGDIIIEEKYIEVAPIDKSKLKDGEITDGIAIITVPDGVLYEINDRKVTLSDSKTQPSFIIDIVSSENTKINDIYLYGIWEETLDEDMKRLTPVFSYDDTRVRDHIWYSAEHYNGTSVNGQVTEMMTSYQKTVSSSTLNFNKEFGKSHVSALVGFEAEKNYTEFMRSTGKDLPVSALHTVATAGTLDANSYYWGNTMMSVLSRAEYIPAGVTSGRWPVPGASATSRSSRTRMS